MALPPPKDVNNPYPKTPLTRADTSREDALMAQYLSALDLQSLHPDSLDALDGDQDERGWVVGGIIALVAALSAAAWLSTTSFFVLSPWGEPALIALLIVATVLLVSVAPAVRRILRGAQNPLRGTSVPAPAWLRWPQLSPKTQLTLMGALALGLVLLVVLVLPRDVMWTGHGYGGQWYLAVGAAITAGVLIGRVLMTAAERHPKKEAVKPIAWPSWMRWVTLSILVATGLGVVIASYVAGNEMGPDAFPLASVGLIVGIGGAIWLVRRFEEMEKYYRKQAEQRAIMRGD